MWGQRSRWELSVLPSQFCYEPKIALKDKAFFFFFKPVGFEAYRRT